MSSRFGSQQRPAAQSTSFASPQAKGLLSFATIAVAFIAAGAVTILIPAYSVAAADKLKSDVLAPSRHSDIIKKTAFALAPKLSEKEPIVYGWSQQEPFFLGMYLVEAGQLSPHPFIAIRNLSDDDLSQDKLMGRGVRYIALSNLWARDTPLISELLQKKFRLIDSFQDDWGTASVFDVTQASAFVVTTIWEERAESASGWRSSSSPLQISLDSVENVEGSASLKLSPGQLATTQNQWWGAELRLDVPKDWSKATSLSFDFKSDVPNQVFEVAAVNLRSADGKTDAQYFFTFTQGPWQRIR